MAKQLVNKLFICIMCCTFIWGFILNLKEFANLVYNEKTNLTLNNLQEKLFSFESNFKEKIKYRGKLIELNGIVTTFFQRSVIGNFEFIKDYGNVLQRVESLGDPSPFINSITNLKSELNARNIPLIYINLPDPTKKLPLPSDMHVFNETRPDLLEFCKTQNIDILDINALYDLEFSAVTHDNFSFHTDVHYTTEAEFWIAQKLCDYLSTNYDLSFNNYDTIFNISDYQTSSQNFLGNCAQSVGKYYLGYDSFTLFTPNFDTDLSVYLASSGQTLTGDFNTTLTHQYKQGEEHYWVTNYAHYPEPYYTIQNNACKEGPSILLIMDSLFLRGACAMSLACNKITILDPRFYNNEQYTEQALYENDFDAVVFVGSSLYGSPFYSKTALPDISISEFQNYPGMWVDYCNDLLLSKGGELPVDPKAQYIQLKGWACDFNAGAPLNSLFVQVGDQVVRCQYGQERTSVSEYFQNDALLKTGFEVKIPMSYLNNGDVDELLFIQVSSDGEAMYQPQRYNIIYELSD